MVGGMADREHVDLLAGDVDEWNRWRAEDREAVPDLAGAGLRGANLVWRT